MFISVYHSSNPVNAKLDSEGLSAAEAGKSTPSKSAFSSLRYSASAVPSELEKRHKVTPASNIEAEINSPSIASSAVLSSSLTPMQDGKA